MEWLQALILGIIEGVTEFFPISSTGHLIVASDLIGFDHHARKAFAVIIQLAAIFAVMYEYRDRLYAIVRYWHDDPAHKKFVTCLCIALIPTIIIGLLFASKIKASLFNAQSVAIALIVGGIIIMLVERFRPQVRVVDMADLSWKDALKIGVAQVFAFVPGASRSGSTIMGGLLVGLDRKVATEFSFFLAILTMFLATGHDLLKHGSELSLQDWGLFSVGFVSTFVSAFFAIRILLRYIANNSFIGFAWYRIAFGVFILLASQQGWVVWRE
jgi:undecaprenyl-diphosphatase